MAKTRPGYLDKIEALVLGAPTWPWLKPQCEPDLAWRMFDTPSEAARQATWDTVWDSAWEEARSVVGYSDTDSIRDIAQRAASYASQVAPLVSWRARWDARWHMACDATWETARGGGREKEWNVVWHKVEAGVREAAMRAVPDKSARYLTLDAATDAALWAEVLVCDGLPLAQEHIDHARARMDVWWRGYVLVCAVGERLYVCRGRRA